MCLPGAVLESKRVTFPRLWDVVSENSVRKWSIIRRLVSAWLWASYWSVARPDVLSAKLNSPCTARCSSLCDTWTWLALLGAHISMRYIDMVSTGRCSSTPYQSKDPSTTILNYRNKDNGKTVEDKKGASRGAKKAFSMLLKPASPTPSNTESVRSFHRDTDREIKVMRNCLLVC